MHMVIFYHNYFNFHFRRVQQHPHSTKMYKFKSFLVVAILLIAFASITTVDGACDGEWRSAGTYEPTPTCYALCQARCLIFFQTSEFSCPLTGFVLAQCKCCKR